jgi:hypothetical protein
MIIVLVVAVIGKVSVGVEQFVACLRQEQLCFVVAFAVGMVILAGLLKTSSDNLLCKLAQGWYTSLLPRASSAATQFSVDTGPLPTQGPRFGYASKWNATGSGKRVCRKQSVPRPIVH